MGIGRGGAFRFQRHRLPERQFIAVVDQLLVPTRKTGRDGGHVVRQLGGGGDQVLSRYDAVEQTPAFRRGGIEEIAGQ